MEWEGAGQTRLLGAGPWGEGKERHRRGLAVPRVRGRGMRRGDGPRIWGWAR